MPHPRVGTVLASFVRHPVTSLVQPWNWKSAILSSAVRGLLFFVTNVQAGYGAAWRALATELAYRGVSAGFLGAMTQSFRSASPRWLASCVAMVVLPAAGHTLEWLAHRAGGTPNLRTSMAASVGFTALSTLFHLHAMRRGALIVGEGRAPLFADLQRIPSLLCDFVVSAWSLLRNGRRWVTSGPLPTGKKLVVRD